MMKIYSILIFFTIFSLSCGKKSSLEHFKDSDYPRSYPNPEYEKKSK